MSKRNGKQKQGENIKERKEIRDRQTKMERKRRK